MPYPRPFQGPGGNTSGLGFVSGTGKLRLVTVPAGVATVTLTVPGNVMWRLLSICGTVTQPGFPAPAHILLFVNDPSGAPYVSLASFSQIQGGGTVFWSFNTNTAGTNALFGSINGQWGESMYALGGGSLSYTTFTFDPLVSFSTALLLVEEWVTG